LEATNAAYCACYNHALDLTISVCSTVGFHPKFNWSNQSNNLFLTAAVKRRVVIDSIHEKRINKLCESRWVERIDGISDFCSSFETVIKILDDISDWDVINV
jgi:hypothetical protein